MPGRPDSVRKRAAVVILPSREVTLSATRSSLVICFSVSSQRK